jgi:translation initiation factor 3 subunit B
LKIDEKKKRKKSIEFDSKKKKKKERIMASSSSSSSASTSSPSGVVAAKKSKKLELLAADEYNSAAEEIAVIEQLLDEPAVQMDDAMDALLVVDNVPVVKKDRYGKLMKVLRKLFKKFGEVVEILMPRDESDVKTLGFMFVEYKSARDAAKALKELDGYKLDKKHVFSVNAYRDLSRYDDVDDVYRAPPVKELPAHENYSAWLLDERAIDQYVVRYGKETEIYWNEVNKKPEPLKAKSQWADTYVSWSPRGTYLATGHPQGVILWAGENWDRVMRFEHRDVKLLEFSPRETYLITLSPRYERKDNPADPRFLIVWDVVTGAKLRSFTADPINVGRWPIFQWSHDDKYLARLSKQGVAVYETPSIKLQTDPTSGKARSLQVPGATRFSWSPRRNVVAAYVPSDEPRPARIVVIDVARRRQLVNRTTFNVTNAAMTWEESGKYLCVKLDIMNKKQASAHLDVFRMTGRNIPVDTVKLERDVLALAFEPNGNRLAVIHKEPGLVTRPDVTLHQITAKKVVETATFEKRAANAIFWSPGGRFVVFAGLAKMNGHFEFVDAQSGELIAEQEHFSASECAWDPTGRHFSTAVTAWASDMENGYNIWSFSGKLIHKQLKQPFFQLLWRPRPPTELASAEIAAIKKNLADYSKRYAQADIDRKRRLLADLAEARQQKIDAFHALERRATEAFAEHADQLRALWGFDIDEEDRHDIVQVEEEQCELLEEIVLDDDHDHDHDEAEQ